VKCGATTEAVKSDRNSSSETTTPRSEGGKARTVPVPVNAATNQTVHQAGAPRSRISVGVSNKAVQTPQTVVLQTAQTGPIAANPGATIVRDIVAQT